MTITVSATKSPAPSPYLLHAELLAALPSVYVGLSVSGTAVTVYLSDAASGANQTTVTTTITNHPVLENSAAGDLAAAKSAATTALAALNFTSLRSALDAASFTTAQRNVLRDVLRAVYYAAAAQGLTYNDPGA